MSMSVKSHSSQVLIVDDDYFNLSTLELKLKQKKLRCDKAQSPDQAIKLISDKIRNERVNYRLIITDINLQANLDGYQLIDSIR